MEQWITKVQKLQTACKLHMAGVQMKKLQLRRKYPNASLKKFKRCIRNGYEIQIISLQTIQNVPQHEY